MCLLYHAYQQEYSEKIQWFFCRLDLHYYYRLISRTLNVFANVAFVYSLAHLDRAASVGKFGVALSLN